MRKCPKCKKDTLVDVGGMGDTEREYICGSCGWTNQKK